MQIRYIEWRVLRFFERLFKPASHEWLHVDTACELLGIPCSAIRILALAHQKKIRMKRFGDCVLMVDGDSVREYRGEPVQA